jgi:hypothetical protein
MGEIVYCPSVYPGADPYCNIVEHLKTDRLKLEQENAALRSLAESLEEVKAEQKALIEADGERMEAARCALHKGNARCTGEGKQEAIIAALDAIGWEAPDA